MCDSLCSRQADRTLFAKSSDRPPSEPQVVEHRRRRSGGGRLRAQYLALDDLGAAALVGSRPIWTWGLEHGVNEHGVAIGNEQLWTVDDPRHEPDALTGLDLVRLGLERGRTAEEAVDVVVSLIEEHGQGGIADRDEQKAYFSSFLVADPKEAWTLETSARSWAARRTDPDEPGMALSNRISLSTHWSRASRDVEEAGDFDRWRRASSPTAHADKRLAVTAGCVSSPTDRPTAAALAGVLRDHDGEPWGRPDRHEGLPSPLPPAVIDRNGTGVSVCMHLHDVQATTSSMIALLPRDGGLIRIWSLLGSPCVGLFVPSFPFDDSDAVPVGWASATTWQRFRRLRDRVERARADEPGSVDELARIRAVWAPLEHDLWAEADDLASAERPARTAWSATVWPRIEEGLDRLAV
jgi:secernin